MINTGSTDDSYILLILATKIHPVAVDFFKHLVLKKSVFGVNVAKILFGVTTLKVVSNHILAEILCQKSSALDGSVIFCAIDAGFLIKFEMFCYTVRRAGKLVLGGGLLVVGCWRPIF